MPNVRAMETSVSFGVRSAPWPCLTFKMAAECVQLRVDVEAVGATVFHLCSPDFADVTDSEMCVTSEPHRY